MNAANTTAHPQTILLLQMIQLQVASKPSSGKPPWDFLDCYYEEILKRHICKKRVLINVFR